MRSNCPVDPKFVCAEPEAQNALNVGRFRSQRPGFVAMKLEIEKRARVPSVDTKTVVSTTRLFDQVHCDTPEHLNRTAVANFALAFTQGQLAQGTLAAFLDDLDEQMPNDDNVALVRRAFEVLAAIQCALSEDSNFCVGVTPLDQPAYVVTMLSTTLVFCTFLALSDPRTVHLALVPHGHAVGMQMFALLAARMDPVVCVKRASAVRDWTELTFGLDFSELCDACEFKGPEHAQHALDRIRPEFAVLFASAFNPLCRIRVS